MWDTLNKYEDKSPNNHKEQACGMLWYASIYYSGLHLYPKYTCELMRVS